MPDNFLFHKNALIHENVGFNDASHTHNFSQSNGVSVSMLRIPRSLPCKRELNTVQLTNNS